jgi:hypothetical protein
MYESVPTSLFIFRSRQRHLRTHTKVEKAELRKEAFFGKKLIFMKSPFAPLTKVIQSSVIKTKNKKKKKTKKKRNKRKKEKVATL